MHTLTPCSACGQRSALPAPAPHPSPPPSLAALSGPPLYPPHLPDLWPPLSPHPAPGWEILPVCRLPDSVVAEARIFKIVLDPSLSHPASNPPANPIGLPFKTDPEPCSSWPLSLLFSSLFWMS